MKERFRIDPEVRMRFESRIDGGTGFVFHNRRQSLRQCGRAEMKVLRALADEARSASELSTDLGLPTETLATFLNQLEEEEIVYRAPRE